MKSLFDFKVHDFDGHIRRSIPAVDDMYDLCHGLTFALAQEGTFVADLGCSTGKFLTDTVKRPNVQYVGVDRCVWQRGHVPQTQFITRDLMAWLRDDCIEGASVALSLFTLQFLPWKDRVEAIGRVAEGLVDGGAFIIAEKVHLADPCLSEIVERNLLEWKRLNFDDKAILDKSASLAGAMRRMKQGELVDALNKEFSNVNVVWAHGEFVCLVAMK
jgi:tRNA (cmo5U34)-methyltransferase